jgi:S-adenosylmethionine:tRNA ribosyltransferase-isomerase
MYTADFDYHLPPELIAQTPTDPRDHARLLVLNRNSGAVEHLHFYDLTKILKAGDVLVLNKTRVLPARLNGNRIETGGKIEILLLRRLEPGIWEALVRPGRTLQVGAQFSVGELDANMVTGQILKTGEKGMRTVSISDDSSIAKFGQIALPPYIHTFLEDPNRYQTIYASEEGSVAAPTAGLHFTSELLGRIRDMGVEIVEILLHIGLDTFRPIQVDKITEHKLHTEYYSISGEAARSINLAKKEKRRIFCVGTTSVRTLEQSALKGGGKVIEGDGWADLFIFPQYKFDVVDALVTNFHLPKSSLLMLVSAFTGREIALNAYRDAISRRYRFYSFGDAMVIL